MKSRFCITLSLPPPPKLQYVDDALIVASALVSVAYKLRSILHTFSATIGLNINFAKTTFVPINVTLGTSSAIAAILGTNVSLFPQVYLGLPLSPTRLPSNMFLPILEHRRKFLFGWHAKLLSKGDHLVLLSSVIDVLTMYFMTIFLIPK